MTDDDIQKLIDGMTIEQKIGQMFMGNICGGETLDLARRNFERFHFGGVQYSGVFERLVRGGDYMLCGVCRNVPLEEEAEFLEGMKAAAEEIVGIPVILGGDQEGGIAGSIFRRRNVSVMPRQMGLGAAGDPGNAFLAATITAREVKTLGLDMLYGPSLDVNTNPKNPEIGARSFSDDPEVVAAFGEQIIRAYAAENVISTVKHFPGRGRGAVNAHHELESIDVDRKTLDEVELLPFRRAIAAGVDSVMVGHTHFPVFDKERIPSSLSPAVVDGLLRQELGFDGLIIPDTLTMFAVSKNFGVPWACARCLEAGVDMIFMKVQDLYQPAIDAIKESVRAGRLTEERMNTSLQRILKLKRRRGLFDRTPFRRERVGEVVGCKEHADATAELARKAVLVLKNKDQALPVPNAERTSVLAVIPRDGNIVLSNDPVLSHDMLPRALGTCFGAVESVVVDETPTAIQAYEAVARAKNADIVVFGIYSAGPSGEQMKLLESIVALDADVFVLLTETPYVAAELPEDVRAVICSFGMIVPAFRAVADVMVGRLKAQARLPVAVSEDMPRGKASRRAT